MENLKLGVIGTGNMGMHHTRIYKALATQCELCGVYDADAARCRNAAKTYDVRAFETLDELLDNVQAVSIAVPTVYHYETAKAALSKGVHVLLEKPVTQNPEQGEELAALAEKNNLILQVGHIERFNPAVQVLPEILKDKKIIALDFKRLSPYDPRISDVDVVQDLMIHDIDVLRYLMPQKILRIEALGVAPRSQKNRDYASVLMELDGGIVACLCASRITEQKIRKIELSADDSFIELDYIERKILIARTIRAGFNDGNRPSYKQESVLEKVFVPNFEPLMKEIESFIACVKTGVKPLVGAYEGVEALRVVKAIQKKLYG